MISFSAKVIKLDINPCVNLSENILNKLFRQAGKSKGPIPVKGKLNGKNFLQTVVRYKGEWRLYLNTQMRVDACVDVGDKVKIELEFDPSPRLVPMLSDFNKALSKNIKAKNAFEKLPPSHQKEILRYLNSLKSKDAVSRNVKRAILQLTGKKADRANFLVRK